MNYRIKYPPPVKVSTVFEPRVRSKPTTGRAEDLLDEADIEAFRRARLAPESLLLEYNQVRQRWETPTDFDIIDVLAHLELAKKEKKEAEREERYVYGIEQRAKAKSAAMPTRDWFRDQIGKGASLQDLAQMISASADAVARTLESYDLLTGVPAEKLDISSRNVRAVVKLLNAGKTPQQIKEMLPLSLSSIYRARYIARRYPQRFGLAPKKKRRRLLAAAAAVERTSRI